jgi:hypothetical protein
MAEGSPQNLMHIYPPRLLENHKKIYTLIKPLKNKDFDKNPSEVQNIIEELQTLLNDSQPQNEEEALLKRQLSLHFNKDRKGFYNHLYAANLRFLVLWTNYAYISIYYGLNNKIHVRWVGTHYICEPYDKSKRKNIQDVADIPKETKL